MPPQSTSINMNAGRSCSTCPARQGGEYLPGPIAGSLLPIDCGLLVAVPDGL